MSSILVISKSAHTLRVIDGGAISMSGYVLSSGVGLRHAVVIRAVSLMAISTSFEWADFPQIGAAYSAVEKHNAKADVRRT